MSPKSPTPLLLLALFTVRRDPRPLMRCSNWHDTHALEFEKRTRLTKPHETQATTLANSFHFPLTHTSLHARVFNELSTAVGDGFDLARKRYADAYTSMGQGEGDRAVGWGHGRTNRSTPTSGVWQIYQKPLHMSGIKVDLREGNTQYSICPVLIATGNP